jgi:hypothetical protein
MSENKQGVTILRDTREKEGHGWIFDKDDFIEATEITKLNTGDYTIKGYENLFTIERKLSTSEISNNIFEKRFEEELQRLEGYKFPFMVFEFSMEDIMAFPVNSGIPRSLWPKLKIKGAFLLSAIMRYHTIYKTKIIFAGSEGKNVAKSLFKMIVKYAK